MPIAHEGRTERASQVVLCNNLVAHKYGTLTIVLTSGYVGIKPFLKLVWISAARTCTVFNVNNRLGAPSHTAHRACAGLTVSAIRTSTETRLCKPFGTWGGDESGRHGDWPAFTSDFLKSMPGIQSR